MSKTAKQVLWTNISALMLREFGKENLTALAKKAKIGPGTATRIKEQSTSVGLEVLEQIARAFGVQPWHLLLPDFDASNPQAHPNDAERWPFEHVSQAAYELLTKEERIYIQGYLARAIDEKNNITTLQARKAA